MRGLKKSYNSQCSKLVIKHTDDLLVSLLVQVFCSITNYRNERKKFNAVTKAIELLERDSILRQKFSSFLLSFHDDEEGEGNKYQTFM